MKKITLGLLTCVAFFSAKAQIFSENFNAATSLPTGWTTSAQTGTQTWQVGETAFYSDFTDNVAYFDDDDAGEDVINKASLISPNINLATASNAKLNFSFVNEQSSEPSSLTVEGFNGTAWVQLYIYNSDNMDWDGSGYAILTDVTNIDLSQFTNANFKLRFTYDDAGDWSYGCAVNNISITSASLATAETSIAETWKIYPVPTKDYLNVNKPDNIKNFTLTVTDMSGKEVKHFIETQSKYDLSDLLPGKYFVTISDGKNKIQKKIVKR